MAKKTVVQTSVEAGANERPLASVADYITKTAELVGLDEACSLVAKRFQVYVMDGENKIVARDGEELKGLLATLPQFRSVMREEVRRKAEEAMASDEYADILSEIADLRERIDNLKEQAREIVEASVKPAKLSDFFAWQLSELTEVGTRKGTGGRGKRYNPRLTHYEWERSGVKFSLDKRGDNWALSVDGSVYGEDSSYTSLVNEAYAELLDWTSNMSVPREVGMREQEAAAGLPAIE